jgi:hypothetical protein
VVSVAVKITRVVKQRHVSATPARRSSVSVPTHVAGKDRAMAARAESARKRSAAAMAWLEANIYPFGVAWGLWCSIVDDVESGLGRWAKEGS